MAFNTYGKFQNDESGIFLKPDQYHCFMEREGKMRHIKQKVLVLGFTAFIVLAFNSCSPLFWIKKYRSMPDIDDQPAWNYQERRTINDKNFDLEGYYRKQYGKRNSPKFEARPVRIKESQLIERKDADDAVRANYDRSEAGEKLTFFHLSDVQLRDEQVRLYDKEISQLADYLVPTFERVPLLETFDGAIYYAAIQTINATVKPHSPNDPGRPQFMIHTGDAIDAGVVNELYEFLYITNEIEIPWFNAIGNHDVGTFGNIKPKMIFVNDPFVEFMTMHSKFNFINIHHGTYEFYPFVNISPTNTDRDPTSLGGPLFSHYNGYDRLKYSPRQINEENFFCRDCPGYYAIEVKPEDKAKHDPAIQMIVLDTGFRFGAKGSIDETQFKWLNDELERARDKIVLVFGHHNLRGIDGGEQLKALFSRYPSVVAYFCGHTHEHKINYHAGDQNHFGFWEVITGAVFAYPQQSSLVRLRYEKGLGWLDIYAFNHTIQPQYKDAQGTVQPSPLYKHAELGFKGALNDMPAKVKNRIDAHREERFATLKFPYPR